MFVIHKVFWAWAKINALMQVWPSLAVHVTCPVEKPVMKMHCAYVA